ncbi:MAG: hypothetical protein H0X43_05855 [Nitrosospira sp.]|nr:hypothetical protein [Nitrosospira sp.]
MGNQRDAPSASDQPHQQERSRCRLAHPLHVDAAAKTAGTLASIHAKHVSSTTAVSESQLATSATVAICVLSSIPEVDTSGCERL